MADGMATQPNTLAVRNLHPTHPLSESYVQTYRNTCGSSDGYESAIDRFLKDTGGHPSLAGAMTVSAPIALILGNAFHKFLDGGRGCAEGTPGYRAVREPREVSSDVVEHLESGGLRITTSAGAILIGISPNSYKYDVDGVISIPSMAPQIDDGVPTLSKFSMHASTANQSIPFVESLSSGETYVVRLDDYTLRIFSEGEYIGDVSAFDVFNGHIKDIESDNTLLLRAWNSYQTELLKRGHQLITAMNMAKLSPDGNMLPVTYANREFMHFFRGIEAFRKLGAFQIVGAKKSWEARLIQGQYAKMGNAAGVNEVVAMMLANWDMPDHNGVSSEDLFKWFDLLIENGVGTLFEPFDHLNKVFKMEKYLSEVVEVILPEELPGGLWNGDLEDGLAVRRIIDETIYSAGQAANAARGRARLRFEFDPAQNTLNVTDESVEVHHALDGLKEILPNGESTNYAHLRMEGEAVKGISISLSRINRTKILEATQFSGFIPRIELAEAIRKAFEGNLGRRWADLSKLEQDAAIRNVAGYNDAMGIDEVSEMGTGILVNAISPTPIPRVFIAPCGPIPIL